MDSANLHVLTCLSIDANGNVTSRNVGATFDVFEAEAHRAKGIENEFETFADWQGLWETSRDLGKRRLPRKGRRHFVSDCVSTGRVIRMLTVVDDCTRECPAIEVDSSLGGLRVRRVLDRIASERGLPEAIVLDNGPEFRGRALAAWSEERGVRLEFIQPGKPAQNAYAESFNGRLRDECLNANWLTSLSDARRKIESWRQDYNELRPHSSLNYLPPGEFARTRTELRA